MRKWWVILTGAVVALAFLACEEALEKGQISGNVKDEGQNVSSAYVLLLEEGKMLAGESPLSNGSLTGPEGNYHILLVEPNQKYYVVAVKDTNGDTKYTPGEDPIGYYGRFSETTQTWIPWFVEVGSGEKKTGIDIEEMYILPGF